MPVVCYSLHQVKMFEVKEKKQRQQIPGAFSKPLFLQAESAETPAVLSSSS